MAAPKKTAPVEETSQEVIQQEKVTIFVPKGNAKDEPNLMIGINGKNYLLPKGQQVTVPREVADEFYRSQAAQTALDEKMSYMQDVKNQQM